MCVVVSFLPDIVYYGGAQLFCSVVKQCVHLFVLCSDDVFS